MNSTVSRLLCSFAPSCDPTEAFTINDVPTHTYEERERDLHRERRTPKNATYAHMFDAFSTTKYFAIFPFKASQKPFEFEPHVFIALKHYDTASILFNSNSGVSLSLSNKCVFSVPLLGSVTDKYAYYTIIMCELCVCVCVSNLL